MSRPWSSLVTKRRVFGLLGASLLLGSLSACSFGGHHRGEGMAGLSDARMGELRERFLDKAGRELQLDEAQKARLATLADAMEAQRRALMPAAAANANATSPAQRPREAMAALIQGDRFDRSGAQALIDAKTAAVREQSPAVVSAAADFFDSLKPEQQTKVREFLARGGRHRRFGQG